MAGRFGSHRGEARSRLRFSASRCSRRGGDGRSGRAERQNRLGRSGSNGFSRGRRFEPFQLVGQIVRLPFQQLILLRSGFGFQLTLGAEFVCHADGREQVCAEVRPVSLLQSVLQRNVNPSINRSANMYIYIPNHSINHQSVKL